MIERVHSRSASPMTPPLPSRDDWSQCPIGYLQRYASAEKRQTWRRLVGRTAAILALIAVTASATVYSYLAVTPSPEELFASPHFQEILPLIESFKKGELSAEEMQKVRAHLQACGHCQQMAFPGTIPAAMPYGGAGCPSHAASADGIPPKNQAAR